eukprot:CAMPEP_0195035690 /NCGR_PEP_ID=MMETSP0326_2-20130528/70812_1 /TAXON_ID=2866 ORGANISM="Crypthecodinium cohnii, Strain Seligo" /NCGR_SAMPLE_ID=MMETSP0326_2 /ASSEMBLY_ACC=CAM_ASM_000348 /LENGTH=35 /DNA_ID= /DNA_START= /DNA_END= /DNA_ORIENTATION=
MGGGALCWEACGVRMGVLPPSAPPLVLAAVAAFPE